MQLIRACNSAQGAHGQDEISSRTSECEAGGILVEGREIREREMTGEARELIRLGDRGRVASEERRHLASRLGRERRVAGQARQAHRS